MNDTKNKNSNYRRPAVSAAGCLHILNSAKISICIENNATGQFARLMRAETGYVFEKRINRFDGRPFTLDGLIKSISSNLY